MSKFSSILFSNVKAEIERYLKKEYSKADVLYSPASPTGAILNLIENLYQGSLLYLKNAINQFDLSQANSNNERVIRANAILAGHIPGRAISATGTLKLTLKPEVDLSKDLPTSRITISNKLTIRNKTNGLFYSINIGQDDVTHRITPNYQFFLPIIQGKWSVKNFTGDGTQLQSYQVKEVSKKDIENFNVEVLVNGEVYVLKQNLWDMLPDEKAVIVRTGYSGGIDVVFGNENFGRIPSIGSHIEVRYLLTDGNIGNIFRRTLNDFKFIDDVIAGDGVTIDVDKLFNIEIFNDINFGADKESLNFTKNILPISSNNVLGLPQQYAYAIKRLGVFSHVNAYERSGSIFITATPNIRTFKNQNSDYFSIDLSAFELDNYEKSKIDKYLRTSGNIQLTKKYKIVSPKLSFYTMNIFVMTYSDSVDESVNLQILDKISEYFLDLNRLDRIPKLDIIRELSSISDLHSVDIQFISRKNEEYHRDNAMVDNTKRGFSSTNKDYDPNKTLGIDPILGDIIFEADELPIIRGNWTDRNGIYYNDSAEGNGMRSVNIIKKGSIDSKNRPKR